MNSVFFLKKKMRTRKGKEGRTVYSSTFFLILSSSRLRLLFTPVVSSSTGATSVTLLFFPETSSASLCCLSAGVSVHNELSNLFLLTGPVLRENWRAFNLVGSRSMCVFI
jgi:hypothetical protein